jgi:hypothetical protein
MKEEGTDWSSLIVAGKVRIKREGRGRSNMLEVPYIARKRSLESGRRKSSRTK